jgi:hypothetical protein
MRRLSKEAKRKRVGVADVIHEDVESFVAKCVAEADLAEKIIKFPTVAKRWRRDGSLIRVRQTRSTVHPRAQQTLSVAAMRVSNQDRSPLKTQN